MEVEIEKVKSALKTMKGMEYAGTGGLLIRDGTASGYSRLDGIAATTKIDISGDFILPIKAAEYLSSLTGIVDIDADSNKVTIKTQRSKACFATVPITEASVSIPEATETIAKITSGSLMAGLRSVKDAVLKSAYNSAQAAMEGVLISAKDGKCEIVACDGVRVHVYSFVSRDDFSVLLHRKAVIAVMSILDGDPIEIKKGKNVTALSDGETTVTALNIRGEFIDYQKLFAPGNIVKTNVGLDTAVKNAIMANTLGKTTPITLYIKKDRITVTMKSASSEFECDVPCESESEIKISFNPKFLEEALSPCDYDIQIAVTGPEPPITIASGDVKVFLLPVRTR